MKISKAKLRQIIKEEIGRAIEPKDGWTTTKDPGGRKRPLRKTVPVGEEDPKKKRDYDEEDLLAMQHGNPEGSPPELREDADDDREALELKIEELENLISSNYHRSALNDERIVSLAIKLGIDVSDLGGHEGSV